MTDEADTNSSGEKTKSLWEIEFFHLSRRQHDTIPQVRNALRACSNPLGPYLADVHVDSPAAVFDREDVAAVESCLIRGLTREESIPRLRILKTIITALNRHLQKSIPRPSRLDRLMKDPNLIPERLAEIERRIVAWAEAENRWSEQQIGFATHESKSPCPVGCPVAWQMVIASAALHDGLLCVDRAVALVRAMAAPRQHFGCSEIRGYADLALPTGGGSDEQVLRWYPGNRLLVLFSRVPSVDVQRDLLRCSPSGAAVNECNGRIAQAILNGIVDEFERQNVDPGLLPRSLHDFLVIIAQYMRPELSVVLTDYASGKLRSASLLPASMGRINGDPTVYRPEKRTEANPPADRHPGDVRKAYSCKREDTAWMRCLRRAFRQEDVRRTLLAIDALDAAADTPPAGRQVCTLARKLLTGTAYSGNSWDVSSVERCVLTVARQFAIGRKLEDPAGYSRTTLEELYRLAIEEAAEDSASPQRMRAAVTWALREYHRHLVAAYRAVPINEAVAFPCESGTYPVDAHVLSVDEIFDALEYIEVSRNRRWSKLYRTVARGQMILAFGGLRRAEGLGLMPSDVQPGPFCEVTVRDNESRGLKTRNAYRRVRLGVLAHPFPELLDPVRELVREAESLDGDLSCGVSDDVIVPIIHEAIQAVAGTEECHLHSLRHSAAHWMCLRLMIADLDRTPNLFPHLPKTTLWLQTSREARSLLLHNGQSMNDHAWAIAVIMGHSNPTTVTIPSYVHCLDLLLRLYLEARTRLGRAATREELRGLSGLPRSTAYFRLPALGEPKHNSDTAASSNVRTDDNRSSLELETDFALTLFRERLGLAIHPHVCSAPPAKPRTWLAETYDMLWMSFDLGLSRDKLATIFGLDLDLVDSLLSRAGSLLRTQRCKLLAADMRGREKIPAEIHLEKCKVPGPPRLGIDSAVLSRWSIALERLAEQNRKRMAGTVRYIAANLLPLSAQIVFADIPQPELVQSCLRLLSALGFRLGDLEAITCDGNTHLTPLREWLRRWGLSWRISVTNQSGPNRTLKISPPWVVVGPTQPDGASSVSRADQAEALCFLFTMAAIRFAA